MNEQSTRARSFPRWLLLYLWSAPFALLLIDLAGWGYDDVHLLWWLATAYGFPFILFGEPLRGAGLGLIVAGYFATLIVVSVFVWRFRRHSSS